MKPNIKLIPKQKQAFTIQMDHITEFILYGGGAGNGKVRKIALSELIKKNSGLRCHPGYSIAIGSDNPERL